MRTRWALVAAGACCTWMMGAGTARAEEPAKPSGAADAAPVAAPTEEEEGPFAPKGRTGRLRKPAETERAEEPEVEHEKPPGRAGLDVVFGFGKQVSEGEPADARPISLVLGGAYRLTPQLALGLRVPFSTAKVHFQDKEQSGNAFGNVEISAAYFAKLGAHTEIPVELGLAVPTATGDAFSLDPAKRRAALVNEAAAQSRGFEEDALFSPHRFGIVPKVGIEYEKQGLALSAYTKVELLAKVGGTAPGPEQVFMTLSTMGIVSVTGGEAFYYLWHDRIGLGARAWFAYLAKETVELEEKPNVESPSKAQLVFEPGVRGRFGRFRANLGFIAPAGGQLGGNMTGLRLGAGVVF